MCGWGVFILYDGIITQDREEYGFVSRPVRPLPAVTDPTFPGYNASNTLIPGPLTIILTIYHQLGWEENGTNS